MTQVTKDQIRDEIWRIVDGYETFEISDHGNIRNIKKKNNRAFKIDADGYRRVTLRQGYKSISLKIHNLVMKAFFGDRPEGMVINHKDHNKQNNHISNLEYISVRENVCHSRATPNRGAVFDKRSGKWHSRVRVDGKGHHLGTYGTPEQAAAAYRDFLKEKGIENRYAK